MDGAPAFDWDSGNLAKCQKHGVSIDEIQALFRSAPYVGRDERHSEKEDRYVAVGRSNAGRAILVIYTLRIRGGVECVRPVSARYMHQRETRWYEEDAAKDQN